MVSTTRWSHGGEDWGTFTILYFSFMKVTVTAAWRLGWSEQETEVNKNLGEQLRTWCGSWMRGNSGWP
jgi:hypothetical protein